MVGSVIKGAQLRGQLQDLGVSLLAFSEFIHMDRVHLRRTLTGSDTSPEAVYRVLLGLQQLEKRGPKPAPAKNEKVARAMTPGRPRRRARTSGTPDSGV
jgi:hypothetical protein